MKLGSLRTYVKEHGIRSSVVLTVDRLLHRQIPEVDYGKWLERHRPSSREYDRMEKHVRPDGPVFGVSASMGERDRVAFMQSLDMQVYRKFRPLKKSPQSEYILVVGGPCTLRPDLLWKCADLLEREKDQKIDLIYFDSDIIGEDGRKENPSFRPDYDPDLLRQVNYMGDVVMVRHDLFSDAVLPTGKGEPFHTFLKTICRLEDGAEGEPVVRHIAEVLYHEASGDESVFSEDEGSDEQGETGYTQTAPRPLVSVMIPNKDHIEDLDRCVTSLLHKNSWDHLEILIIENNSARKETFEYYERIQKTDERIRVVTWEGPFNYSAINNFGFQSARGEYILLLNNDTKILEKDSIAKMVQLSSRPDVGSVGALLLYPEGAVQHAGIILGHGGIAGHAWEGENPIAIPGAFPAMVFSHVHNVSAVTGACMMMKRSDYEAAGGLDESLEVTFNDVDLCLRLRRMGRRILMCPTAQLIHYESASRGSEDSPQKIKRFHREISIFVHRWEKELEKGDPYYNPNLTLTGKTWTCKDELRESAKPYLKYLHMEVEEES